MPLRYFTCVMRAHIGMSCVNLSEIVGVAEYVFESEYECVAVFMDISLKFHISPLGVRGATRLFTQCIHLRAPRGLAMTRLEATTQRARILLAGPGAVRCAMNGRADRDEVGIEFEMTS